MLKSVLGIFCLIFLLNNLDAQTLSFSKSAGSNSPSSDLDQGYDIVIDNAGNSYVTGIMSNWTTGSVFGEGQMNQTILNVNGAFIAKYDINGSLIWAKQIEANNNGVESNAIALDLDNNIYITGYYSVEVTFGVRTANQTTLNSNSRSRDIFFAKYSPNGDFLFAKSFGGVNDDAPGGNDIYVDSNKNIYLTGTFDAEVVFGKGETNETTLIGNQQDMFLSKYNSDGELIWVQKAGGNFGDSGKSLDLDSQGNIYVTGDFFNTILFTESGPNEVRVNRNNVQAYIAKYDTNGKIIWANSPYYYSDDTSNISGAIKLTSDDQIIYSGTYYNFGSTYLTNCIELNGIDSYDAILIKFDSNGNYIWNSTLQSTGNTRGLALDIDAFDIIYMTGYFGGDVILDEGKCTETRLNNKGDGDIFITTYNTKGQLLSATSAGSSGWDQAAGIAVDDSGTINITGYYTENIIFGQNEIKETTLLKNGVNEIFIAQYKLDLNGITTIAYAGESNCIEICSDSDPVNLFDSLLNNPDSGGVWSPSLASGSGIFDPSVDNAGIYRYSVMESNCVSDFSEITVDFNTNTLNAGDDTRLNSCFQDGPFNLFDRIEGNPDRGGTWFPALTSGSDIFDPSIDSAGVYQYILSSEDCKAVSSKITVSISKDIVNAGTNGSITICGNDPNFNLFDILNDNPDIGGTWTPVLSSGTGIFDPSRDAPGVYTYKITNGTCGEASSEVEIIINKVPNAGIGGSLNVCTNVSSIDLIEGLSGNPDEGGTWSPALSSGTGIFDPKRDPEGVYTYTVSSISCGTDSSDVNVKITNVSPVSDYEIIINEFSTNNSIEILINSNIDYEFSLDGTIYQSSNVFNELLGGDYTVYAKEINGCGILQQTVSILDYPRFFTPNNDGYNDTWSLKGKTDKMYSIYIFDRYGKLLKNLPTKGFWDGTFKGKNLPSDDYWFKVVFSDGVVKSGNFTLKR